MPPLIETIEQASCPHCTGVIDRSHVLRTYPRGMEERRTVRAYCSFCDKGWKVTQALRGGNWGDQTTPDELHGRDLDDLRKVIEKKDNTRRVEALAG